MIARRNIKYKSTVLRPRGELCLRRTSRSIRGTLPLKGEALRRSVNRESVIKWTLEGRLRLLRLSDHPRRAVKERNLALSNCTLAALD